jgi:hypothetical protein
VKDFNKMIIGTPMVPQYSSLHSVSAQNKDNLNITEAWGKRQEESAEAGKFGSEEVGG